MSSNLSIAALCGLLTLGATTLAGCGFTPLYGDAGATDVPTQLDAVQVQNIPERPGQLLREALEYQLHAAGTPTQQLYSLNVLYSITSTGVGVQPDTSITYDRSIATAKWTLTPIGNPYVPLTTGQATSANAANIIDQQYFALTPETNTINQQLADDIAQQIGTQLAAYFKTHPGA